MSEIIFDVGANDGKTYLGDAMAGHRVYAFEPTPKLIQEIKAQSWFTSLPNYRLIEKAVSIENGKATFNIAGRGDWGCSSLLEFSDNLEVTWPGQTLTVTDKVEVETIRLDTFIEQHDEPIPYISFLHVDTQGHDLVVLKSLGKYIDIVRAGCVEVPQSVRVHLYKNQHSREEMVDFLQSNGFTINRITHQMNEDNLFFQRA